MKVIHARNVNDALPKGLYMLKQEGRYASPRGKRVLEMPCPVTTVYNRPEECVLIDNVRHANPFFHLIEGLWILGGRYTTTPLTFYNKQMAEYSDDGNTFHGAYGARLMGQTDYLNVESPQYPGVNQLEFAIKKLEQDPMSRQAMAAIWQPWDIVHSKKDIPCNTSIMFTLREGVLDMTVTCRSNDVVWGAYGANAVQFSLILQYVAYRLNVRTGKLYQFSNNYHVYRDTDSADIVESLMKDSWLNSKAENPYNGHTNPVKHPFVTGYEGVESRNAIAALLDKICWDINMLEHGNPDATDSDSYDMMSCPLVEVAWNMHRVWTYEKIKTLYRNDPGVIERADERYHAVNKYVRSEKGKSLDWYHAADCWLTERDRRREKTNA